MLPGLISPWIRFCRCIWRRGAQIWIASSIKRAIPEIALPARRASSSKENGAYTSAKRPRYWVEATARMAQLSCSISRSANSFLSSRVARSSSSSLTAVAIMNEPPE